MSIADALKYADMMRSNGLTRRQHDAALQSLADEVRRLQPVVAPEFGDTTSVVP